MTIDCYYGRPTDLTLDAASNTALPAIELRLSDKCYTCHIYHCISMIHNFKLKVSLKGLFLC